jgi:hypothetical protein
MNHGRKRCPRAKGPFGGYWTPAEVFYRAGNALAEESQIEEGSPEPVLVS